MNDNIISGGSFFVSLLTGLLLATGFQLVLTLLSMALGISLLGNIEQKWKSSPSGISRENKNVRTPGVMTNVIGAWTLLTACISLFFAAMLAVKLSLVSNKGIDMVLGLSIWAIFFIGMLIVELKTTGTLLGGLFRAAFNGMKTSAKLTQEALTKSEGEKIADAIRQECDVKSEDGGQIKEKFEHYLKNTDVEALNPEGLKEDLHKIVETPKSTKSVVLNRIKQFDHPTLVSIVSQTTHLSKEQADHVVSRVESALQGIKEKIGPASDQQQGLKQEFESKVREYFNSLQRPELDYDVIKRDLERMLHDPKASIEILKNRFKSFDRKSLTALVASNPHISPQQADHMVDLMEETKDNVLAKVQVLELGIKQKIDEAKERALHQAEAVRKNVVAVTWWIFCTAFFSGLAAACGGLLAF